MVLTKDIVTWKIGDRLYDLSHEAMVMGILNVTPDSFFDGGRYSEPYAAVRRALEMEAEGAAIIDLGGESTRPGADSVSEEEEIKRVLPVLERMRRRVRCLISIDTTKAGVARVALDAGADIVNDVSGLKLDPGMIPLLAKRHAAVILMHRQGTPKSMQENPAYDDVVLEVRRALLEGLHEANARGIRRERMVLDPGIGFGKRVEHNLALLRNCDSLAPHDLPLLIGVSRKSFIGAVQGLPGIDDRFWSGIALSAMLRRRGVRIFRVHDVRATVEAVRMTEAIMHGVREEVAA